MEIRGVTTGSADTFSTGGRQVIASYASYAEVLDYYAAMDVLVYPRYPSPLTDMISPLKPLEPMSMERAVVGGRLGSAEDTKDMLAFSANHKVKPMIETVPPLRTHMIAWRTTTARSVSIIRLVLILS